MANKEDDCTYLVGVIMSIDTRKAHPAVTKAMNIISGEDPGGLGVKDAVIFVEAREESANQARYDSKAYLDACDLGFAPAFNVRLKPGDPRGEFGLYAIVGVDKTHLDSIYEMARRATACYVVEHDLIGQVMKETGIGNKHDA